MRLTNPKSRRNPTMPGFLPAPAPKGNGCGLACWLLRRADVSLLDHVGPFGDFGFDVAVECLGRAGVDRHPEIGEALLRIRLSHEPRHFHVQPADDLAWSR